MSIAPGGQLKLNNYTSSGSFTGTAVGALQFDASGNIITAPLSGGGTPAGSTGQVQFNNAGAFGASANLFWDATNSRLGIGTTAPGRTLHVVGDVLIRETAAQPSGLSIQNATRYFSVSVDAIAPDDGIFTIIDGTAGLNRFSITSNGNVGIGITTPFSTVKLHVKQTSANFQGIVSESSAVNDNLVSIGHDGTVGAIISSYLTTGAYTPLTFRTSDLERMRILANGNVGIGTSNPRAPLEVLTVGNDLTVQTGLILQQFNPGSPNNTAGISLDFGVGNNGGNLGILGRIIVKETFFAERPKMTFNLWNGSNVMTERMVIDYLGKVGIGTTTPSAPLHVAATVNTTGIISATTGAMAGGNHNFFTGHYTNGATDQLVMGFNSSGANNPVYSYINHPQNLPIILQTGTGRVGIGTVNVGSTLTVNDGNIELMIGDVTKSYLGVSNGPDALVAGSVAGDFGYRSVSGSHLFSVNNGASLAGTVLTIKNTGNVGIGTTTPSAKLHVQVADNANAPSSTDGHLKVINSGTGVTAIRLQRDGGTVSNWAISLQFGLSELTFRAADISRYSFNTSGTATAVAWTATSDRRLKASIRPFIAGLESVLKIAPLVSVYDRMEVDSLGRQTKVVLKSNEVGFIAQELQKIAPQYVYEPANKEGMMSINYSQMVAPLYKAVEELNEQIIKLKAELLLKK
jgi:hypothetical protein